MLPRWLLGACLCLWALVPAIGAAGELLLVMGIEYSPWPDHYCVSGVAASIDSFAYQGQPIPPFTHRAQDILGLSTRGDNPLWWVAHPNWKDFYTPPLQAYNLIGVIHATGHLWYPDAIGLVNVGIQPPWRRQVALEMANIYASVIPANRIPAYVLEVDFHHRPSIWFEDCGGPYTLVWVPEDWRQLSGTEAMEEIFSAVRDRRTLGTVGDARFASCELTDSTLALTLTRPIEHVQLWAGGSEPVATWSNTAVATFPLANLAGDEPFLNFFAYGDSAAGQWDLWSCNDKEVFFTSPLVRGEGTFDNPYGALAGMIPIKVLFHQHTSLSIDGGPELTLPVLFDDCRSLGIDAVLVTDHNPPAFTGSFPSFITLWDELPTTAVWSAAPPDVVGNGLAALPNPVVRQREVHVRYELRAEARVALGIYDVAGRLVTTVVDRVQGGGAYELPVRLPAPGVFFIRLRVGARSYQTKVTVL